ncbi:TPA: TrfB-related DNA-binding protein [Pseudomonas putida]
MADKRITEDEFNRIWPLLSSWGAKTVAAVRQVLVDGRTRKEACKQLDVSRQALQQALKRVDLILSDVPKGWVKVDVFAPPELAKAFLEQVSVCKEEYARDDALDPSDERS